MIQRRRSKHMEQLRRSSPKSPLCCPKCRKNDDLRISFKDASPVVPLTDRLYCGNCSIYFLLPSEAARILTDLSEEVRRHLHAQIHTVLGLA